MSRCDVSSTKNKYRGFCNLFDRNLSVWEFPGTEEGYCEELLVVPHIKTSKQERLEYCREVMGGGSCMCIFQVRSDNEPVLPTPCLWQRTYDAALS